MQEKSYNYQGSKISYSVAGQRDVLLLLHGFGVTGDIFSYHLKHFSKHFKVIVPDMPGSGKSELLNYPEVKIEDFAAAYRSLVNSEMHKNDAKLTIIGHSMGGYIALAYARLFKSEVANLILFHSSVYTDDENKILQRHKSIEFINKNGAYQFLKTTIPELFSDSSKLIFKYEIEDLVKKGEKFSKEALTQYYSAMINRRDQSDFIQNLTIPLLIIAGDKDKAVPLEISLKQSHLANICQVSILPDAGHMGMIERKDQTCSIIASFLDLVNVQVPVV